jgi:hypothetical protein
MPVPVKLALGVLALWGTVYAFAALAGDFAVVSATREGRSGMEAFVIHLHAFAALAAFLIEAGIALNLGSLPVQKRVIWVFAMMFFYPIAIPAFWYLHIWRSRPTGNPPASASAD